MWNEVSFFQELNIDYYYLKKRPTKKFKSASHPKIYDGWLQNMIKMEESCHITERCWWSVAFYESAISVSNTSFASQTTESSSTICVFIVPLHKVERGMYLRMEFSPSRTKGESLNGVIQLTPQFYVTFCGTNTCISRRLASYWKG